MSTVSDLAAGTPELEAMLTSFVVQNRLPGCAAGVICGDELAWSAGAGFADLTTGTATDPAMLYGMDLATLARELTSHHQPPAKLPTPAPESYRPLLGAYARHDLGGWIIRLEWAHGKLVLTTAEAPGWQIVLMPTPDPDLFTIADGGNQSGENATFRRFPDGRVASVLLMDSTWVRLDRVTA